MNSFRKVVSYIRILALFESYLFYLYSNMHLLWMKHFHSKKYIKMLELFAEEADGFHDPPPIQQLFSEED